MDLEPKISKDIKYHLLSDTLESQKSSPFNPRKDLFITKKIKTSFITIKTDISPKTKNVQCNKNNTSIGRWTKQERIKFVLALNKFGTNWKKMMEYIDTRDLIQIKSEMERYDKSFTGYKDEENALKFAKKLNEKIDLYKKVLIEKKEEKSYKT